MILVATLLVASATPPEPIIHDLSFTGPNGWTYDARLLEPAGKRSGLTVLNQAVLLAGVNDDLDVLVELCTRLIDLGVVPYYLHQLDRVAGTLHFEVPEAEGRRLVAELAGRLPGYAVPRYVREVPGAAGKLPL